MANNKKISVIIPCHSVKIAYFSKCINSLYDQTIGIENIQVILVLHNTPNDNKKEIYEFLKDKKEIEVYELNNDIHTPSSPRNYGLDKAIGEYIGFLDADDSYVENVFEKIFEYNKKYDADVITFRREYELEKQGLYPAVEKVMWNQLREVIVATPDNFETEKILVGPCGFITSKIFKRNFLVKNNLRLDEEILFAEDFYFVLKIYSMAAKMIFLPQLIGYRYFINSSSLVQGSGNRTGDELVKYAEGYKKIFDIGLEKGFYMNSIISRLCRLLATYMVASKDITFEQRVKIKEILKPYIELTTMIKADKMMSQKLCEEAYNFPRDIILKPEKWKDYDSKDVLVYDKYYSLDDEQETLKILNKILEENTDTDMGKNYSFGNIMTLSGYKNNMPLTDYAFYEPLINLTTRIGESQIYLKENVNNYIYTPGNTGDSKLFACTDRHIRPYVEAFDNIVKNHDTFLFMESTYIKSRYNDDALTNSLYGTILSEYFKNVEQHKINNVARFTSPRELMFPDKAVDVTFERLFFALRDENVDQIYAPYMWDILISFNFLKKNWETLCDCIEKGELNNTTKISEELRKKLSYIIKPMKDRANNLRDIFKNGFDNNVLKKIWPKLDKIITTSEKTMRIYTKELMSYANDIIITNGFYASAEALIGEPTDEIGIYKLHRNSSFFEFREENEINKTVTCDELIIGKNYEVVVTNHAGLYRYKTGDIIETIDKKQQDIYFKYAFNGKNIISLYENDDENVITNTMVYDVINDVSSICDVKVSDYSYVKDGKKILIILEANSDKNEATKLVNNKQEIEKQFDEVFSRYEVYKNAKTNGIIDGIKILIGEPESHMLYRDLQRKKEYYASDQIRPVRLLDNAEKYKYFTKFIIGG